MITENKKNELISAIYCDDSIAAMDTEEIQKRKEELDAKLHQYVNEGDKLDYTVAVASGIVCGLLDSLFVGKFSISSDDIKDAHITVNNLILKTAKKKGYEGSRLDGAIAFLENKYSVLQDNIWKGADIGVAAKNHHLADLAHHPTLLGLISSIIVQFLRFGIFENKDGKIHIIKIETKKKDIINTWIPVIISGILNWLVFIAEQHYKLENEEDIPKSIKKILSIISNCPIILELLKVADNWVGHLISDMGGSKNTPDGGMGIPGVFLSLAYEISSLPVLKKSGLPEVINRLYVKHKQDLRHELAAFNNIGKQALVVMLNDVIVRTFYFARHLANQLNSRSINQIDWQSIIPFDNKTITRMITISSATFVGVDLTDAAIRGAIEAKGNWAIFAVGFASRLNIVGTARLAISIAMEVDTEKAELGFLHERRLVTEELSARNIEVIERYRDNMLKLMEDYLADDLEAYLEGMDQVQSGFENGNSDAVIKGNVVIQRKLGRNVQFTDQAEFDYLMLSDDALKL